MPLGPRTRVLLIAAVVFAALAALIWYLSFAYWSQPVTPLPTPRQAEEAATPQAPAATPPPQANATPPAQTTTTPAAQPTPSPTPAPTPQARSTSGGAGASLASMRLLSPVAGVTPSEPSDTYRDTRRHARVPQVIHSLAPL